MARRSAAAAALAGTVTLLASAGVVASGEAAHATFPAPNGSIAFAADAGSGSGSEIYSIRADGTGLRRLTHLAGDATHPDWSPSGRRITFALARKDGSSHVMVMRADGRNLRDLTRSGFETQPSFTPDGRHLLFACDCGPQGIFMMGDDGTDRHRLTTHEFPDAADSDPNVSADVRTVTFVRHQVDGQLQALLAVDLSGAHERGVVPYERDVAPKHDWAPNSRQIVLTVDADYPGGRSPNVATVRRDGSHLRLLTHYTGGRYGAVAGSYSPDGRWVVFRVENLKARTFRLYRMHPDGSHRVLVARLPFSPRQPDWGRRPLP
jgi:Tol biopolymer transport system component